NPCIFFAGQITGVEGYMESASSGILAGLNCARRLTGKETVVLPETTMMGALSRYISDESVTDFQPMGANFGILPPIEPKIRDKKERYAALANRAMSELKNKLKD
ncbi:MAG: FAD-dependent oxidoreductase, partial [Eubacterium sp.]|nr:FAD-dependent oxidoreductase [Eubacterium sp.]